MAEKKTLVTGGEITEKLTVFGGIAEDKDEAERLIWKIRRENGNLVKIKQILGI